MKPRKCCVHDCLSDARRKEDEGVTFHRLPPHRDIRERWMILGRIDPVLNKRVLYVCSRHFLRADFCHTKGKKYTLLPGVEPSIFSWNKKAGIQSNTVVAQQNPKTPQSLTVESSCLGLSSNTAESETNTVENTVAKVLLTSTENQSTENIVNNKIQIEERESHEKIVEKEIESCLSASTSHKTNLSVEDFQPETMSSVSTVDQKPRSIITPTGTIVFVPDMKIEALDCQQNWSPATIMEIDCDEDEVLVHFDEYSNKYDEWLSMSSAAIRAPKTTNEYEVGEKCLACWSDFRKFPAKVVNIIDKDTCEVEFDDGYRKIVRTRRMSKPQLTPSSVETHSSSLFDPVKGSKQDRRDKKRKINVTELFGKRPRVASVPQGNSGLDVSEKENVTSATDGVITVIPGIKPGMTGNEDWIIKWNGNVPVGEEATLEFEDGPKNTIHVPDSRLPDKWEKHFAKRSTTGKWEILIVNPEKVKFRSLKEIRHFYVDLNELPKPLNRFDFTHMRPLQKSTKTKVAVQKRPSSGSLPALDSKLEQDNNELARELESQAPEDTASNAPQSPQLKILHIDDSYRCPIDGCGKNFRRENLAQMHIKHYHPEHFKMLDSISTPNVADLAYARTVSDSLEMTTDSGSGLGSRLSKGNEARISTTSGAATSGAATVVKQKDSEIIRLLMNKHPTDCADQSVDAGIGSAQDIRLKDLLSSAASGLPGRPAGSGIRTLLPVSRDDMIIDGDSAKRGRPPKRKRESEEVAGDWNTNAGKDSTTFAPDSTEESQSSQEFLGNFRQHPSGIPPSTTSDIIIEGGQIIRLVRMKQEEIINCACHYTEEDGLMIQCEVCLCWQHATCFNIYTETQVPDNYICHICRNPTRLRPSRAWYYDQEWLKHGRLPSGKYRAIDSISQGKRNDQLRRSHDLTGGLLELRDFMRTLKLKMKISENKNHPKLYLWSKPWVKDYLPEKSNIPTIPMGNDSSMLFSLLKNAKDEQLNQHNSLQLQQLTKHHLVGMPTPEAAIENSDCRLNLLEHIDHCQNLVEERLDDFARCIDDIDDDKDMFVTENEVDNCRIRETMQMIRRDLDVLNDLSRVTTF